MSGCNCGQIIEKLQSELDAVAAKRYDVDVDECRCEHCQHWVLIVAGLADVNVKQHQQLRNKILALSSDRDRWREECYRLEGERRQ